MLVIEGELAKGFELRRVYGVASGAGVEGCFQSSGPGSPEKGNPGCCEGRLL